MHSDTPNDALAGIRLSDLWSTKGDYGSAAPPIVQGAATRSQSPTFPKIMTIDVGGRTFKVMRDTLSSESGLFRHQLSGRFAWEPEADGTYFLDHDPDIFEHLLRFMRRPEIFPLFYAKDAGFNYDLYNRLEVEAEYFQIDALRDWIKEKMYLKAVITRKYYVEGPVSSDVGRPGVEVQTALSIDSTIEPHLIPRTRKVYTCPRGIFVHRGDKNRCGLACRKAQGEDETQYENENYVDVVSIKKETEFVASICKPVQDIAEEDLASEDLL